MTSKKRETINWPVPLRTREHSLGVALREYAQSTEETDTEAGAYQCTRDRVARPPRRGPILAAGLAATGVLAAAGIGLLVHQRDAALSPPEVAAASRSVRPESAPPPGSIFGEHPFQGVAGDPGKAKSLPRPVGEGAPKSTGPGTPTASIRLGAVPAALPAGRVDLLGQAVAVLSPDAVASGRTQTGDTEIRLSKGSIELHVVPRAAGHDFAVSAGPYRFTAVGTAFTVSQDGLRLELQVSEGRVAVSRGTRHLATVGAGGQWAVEVKPASRRQTPRAPVEQLAAVPADRLLPGPPALPISPTTPSSAAFAGAPPDRAAAPGLAPPPATLPLPAVPGAPPAGAATPAAPVAGHRDCGQLATSKRTREALTCYQDQAVQNGLAGETAQYELARLWRDSFGELARALAAFQTQRSRFPNGALRTEADLSIIELLPRLDRHADALTESEQFLAAHPKAERRGEIHLLRGNIFREVLRDLDHAEREYARGAESGGRAGDDSRFLHAVCLEALGQVNEARSAYEAYLLRTKAAHAQEAQKRLERLRP